MGKDKATRAKELAKDTAGAVSEEVARGAGEIKDAAKPMAGSVGTSVKDAVASGVETVGETAKDAASTVTSAVSSAIKKERSILSSFFKKSAKKLDVNEDGKVDEADAAEIARKCAPAKCVIS